MNSPLEEFLQLRARFLREGPLISRQGNGVRSQCLVKVEKLRSLGGHFSQVSFNRLHVSTCYGTCEGIRDTLFFAYRDVQRSVRDERYKLIEYVVNSKQTTQLFDLHADPWELDNLAREPSCAGHLSRLREELVRWREELEDDKETFWMSYGSGA